MSGQVDDQDAATQDEAVLADAETQKGNHARAYAILADAAQRLTSRELAALVSARLLPNYTNATSAQYAPLATTAALALRWRRQPRRASGE